MTGGKAALVIAIVAGLGFLVYQFAAPRNAPPETTSEIALEELVIEESPQVRGIEDAVTAPAPEAEVVTAFPEGLPDADFVEVPIYFATNRAVSDDVDEDDPSSLFSDLDGPVQYGRALVTIPRDHRMGNLESQSWLGALIFEPDPERHVILARMGIFSRDQILADVRSELAETSNSILMYVHGYNTDLDKATRRAGQLTYDLAWHGPSFLFSWPSKGSAGAYFTDSTMALRSETAMRDVLADLASLETDRIVVIAHSMGTRVLSEGLADLARDNPEAAARITTIVLAAPDIDEQVFRSQLAPRFREMSNSRFTLYASSEDTALKASKAANGFPRIGDTTNGVPVVEGIDVIDASGTISDFFGHTYFGDNSTILTDIYTMIHDELPIDARPTVEPVQNGPNVTWRIKLDQN